MPLRTRFPEPPQNMDKETRDYFHSLIRALSEEFSTVVKDDEFGYFINERITDGTGIDTTYDSDTDNITFESTGGGGGEVNTASNLGAGDGLYASKSSVDLQFKSLTAGAGITLTPSGTEISISGTGAAPAWGDITGTLADQTDLQTEIDTKLDVADTTAANMLVSDGANWISVTISGDATIATDGTMTVNAGAADSVIISAKCREAGGITKGQVVYITGATGGFPDVELADNTDYTKGDVLALAIETKTSGQTMLILTSGLLENIDTSAFLEGDVVYLGTTGDKTATHPSGIHAVQRLGRIVKSNASTGSMIVELHPLTVVSNFDGIARHQVVNQSTGTSASVANTMVNDANHRCSISITGSNFSDVAGIADAMIIYNEGYNKTVNAVDGNFGFEWWTDVTDSHNLSSTSKMALSAAGNLTIAGTVDGVDIAAEATRLANTSGTNTGDQTIPVTGVDFDPVGTDNSNNNAVNTLYSGLVTNATHTGDVTGSTALTIAAGAVDIAMLSATGTASSSTFLRGDNTWAAPTASVDLKPYCVTGAGSDIPTAVTTQDLSTEQVTDANYALASDQVTVTDAGTYLIMYSILVDEDGTAGGTRGRIVAWVEDDTVAIPSSYSGSYTREASGGTGLSASCVVTIGAGSVIRLRTDQDGTGVPDMSAERVSLSMIKLG